MVELEFGGGFVSYTVSLVAKSSVPVAVVVQLLLLAFLLREPSNHVCILCPIVRHHITRYPIRSNSIRQEEMHEQMSGYKRMRREHQAHLLKLEEKCKVDMEAHKTALDKEYDTLLHNFTRDLERLEVSAWNGMGVLGAGGSLTNPNRLQTKHQQDVERRAKQTSAAEKKLHKEITLKQEGDRKVYDLNRKKEYKANKERWKRELSMDESTPKRQRDLTLQSQKDNLKQHEAQEEQRMLQAQKQYIELEMRKFKRKRMIMQHEHEDQQLRDVSDESGKAMWLLSVT